MARKQNMTKTVAKGAAGVAAAAGAVALGAALIDKDTRHDLSKTVTNALGTVPKAAKQPVRAAKQMYSAAYHQVAPAGKKRKNRRNRQ
jgi:hypothetical protein